VQYCVDVLAGVGQHRKPVVIRHLAHDDEVVAQPAVGAHEVGNSEVDIGRQPAVEPDLLLAPL